MSDAQRARKVKWGARIGRPLLEGICRSWRLQEVWHPAASALFNEGKPYILSSWHGQLLPHLWANRQRNFCAMVSQHGDGEIIFRIIEGWGYRGVRGSSSRGGREALKAMVDELQSGSKFAITPDGPRGPRGSVQMGVMIASTRSKVPIVPIWSEMPNAWHLKSWDRFQLAKPFSKVIVHYGEPWLPPDTSEASVAELVRRMGPVPNGPVPNGPVDK